MTKLVLPDGLLATLNLAAALDEELKAGPYLLPPPRLDSAVAKHRDEYLKLLESRIKGGLEVTVPEVVLAQKAQRGVRPVPVLPVPVRTLYRALVERMSTHLPPLDRSSEANQRFREAPLRESKADYVALADIVACYQYIDHEILEWELVNQTGEAELAREIRRLLGLISGRSFGLPQNHNPSHALAEVVLDIIERRLTRRGHTVWRFNDDFRLASTAWRTAAKAIEDLERECNRLGLTLNDEKIGIRHRRGYELVLQGADERWREIQSTVAGDLIEYNPYTEEEAAPEDSDVTSAAALVVLEAWAESLDAGKTFYGYEAMQERQLVQNAMFSLEVVEDSRGLDFCARVLKEEPSLTPSVARYFASRVENDSDSVSEAIDGILADQDIFVSEWQSLWLLEALRSSNECSDAQIRWAQALIKDDDSKLVAARAALLLANHDEIDAADIVRLYGHQNVASQPDAVDALVIRRLPAKPDDLIRAVVADAPEYEYIVKEHY